MRVSMIMVQRPLQLTLAKGKRDPSPSSSSSSSSSSYSSSAAAMVVEWVATKEASMLLQRLRGRILLRFTVPLFLLLVTSALFTYPSVNSNILQWKGGAGAGRGIVVSLLPPPKRALNGTLLEHARVDLGQATESREIDRILDGSWRSPTSSSTSSSAKLAALYRERYHSQQKDRFSQEIYDRLQIRTWTSRSRDRLPIQLTSPRYSAFWPQFRQLLQSWVQMKRYQPQIMRELLRLVKEPIDRHYKKNEAGALKPYKTCAVVGNSGTLLNHSYAHLIDSHEMVMRLNNARTTGFEESVGSKTTLAFANSNILHSCSRRPKCSCHPYGENVPMVIYICQAVHFMDVALCGSFHKSPIVITDPRLDVLCTRIVKYYSLWNFIEKTGKRLEDWVGAHEGPLFHYSSGMQAVVLALGVCENVNIFGFGKLPTSKHHYHTNQKEELHLHDYEAEYRFYDDLVNQKSTVLPFLSEAAIAIPPVKVYW